MFPTQAMQGMVDAWVKALASSEELADYCREKFGRKPQIYMGVKTLGSADCPAIMVRPRSKVECAKHLHYVYAVLIDLAVQNPGERVDGNTIEQTGWGILDELGQKVIGVLAEGGAAYPISRLEYSVDPAGLPLLIGRMVLKVEVGLVPSQSRQTVDR